MTPKWLISRRTLLRGGGAAIGLPLLDAMIRPGKAAAQTAAPKRFAVYYKPGGVVMPDWLPTGTESQFTLATTMKPLEPFQQKLVVLEGVDLRITEIGHGHGHSKGMGGVLTGRELPAGPYETCGGNAGFPNGPSIDQVIANNISQGARFKSLELAVNWPTDRRDGGKAAPTNCINYAGPNQAVPMATDPRAVWDKLFRDFGSTEAQLAAQRARSKSILDAVKDSYQSLSKRVGRDDRQKLDQHLTRVREVETSVQTVTTQMGACMAPPVPMALGNPDDGLIGEPGSNQQKNPQLDARMPELGKAMMDLMVMAFTCDLTRVGTMQWVDSQAYNTFPWLNLTDGHHGYQHDNGYQPAQLTRINTWYMEQMAYFLQRLEAVQENGKPLLDSMTVLFVTELQQAESHAQDNMPFLLVGGVNGRIRTGRYLRYNGVPHNNLLVSLLNAYDVPVTTFGNPNYCTGPLASFL